MSDDVRAAAYRELRRLASTVPENDPQAAAERLLERLTAEPDPQLLRDALTWRGAMAALEDARAQRVVGQALDVFAADLAAAEW